MTKSKDRTPIQGMFLTPISIFILIDILLNIIYSNIIIIECFFNFSCGFSKIYKYHIILKLYIY